jgi:MscS family membrane protein
MLDLALFASAPGVPPAWVIRHLPPWTYASTVYGVAVWQWVALPLSFLLSMLVGWLAVAVFVRGAMPIAKRTKTTWDDDLLVSLEPPGRLFAGTTAFWAIVPSIALRKAPGEVVASGVDALLLISLFWGIFGLLDVVAKRVGRRIAGRGQDRDIGGALSLVSICTKMAKILLVIFGFVAVLGQLGLQVTGIIAGLGIGGIAVALAGQKALENLFGSFTLGVDRPMHIGDFVKVDDLQGTVEAIGLRSTRIRTLDRSLVTMPNGRLVDQRIENYSVRDRMRLHEKLGLVYTTKGQAVRAILEEMRQYLAERPGTYQESINVNLTGFGDSALVVEVMVWYETREWTEFLAWREETLLGLMEITEKHGSAFAFPTQTILVEAMPSPAPPGKKV